MKKKICTIITAAALAISCAPLVVNAGNYTSSDPNKNSSFNLTGVMQSIMQKLMGHFFKLRMKELVGVVILNPRKF